MFRCIDTQGKKTFRQCHPVPGGWVMETPPKPWPLYAIKTIRTTDTVIVVEGEKCAHALLELGMAATTSSAGAGEAEYADWTPLVAEALAKAKKE